MAPRTRPAAWSAAAARGSSARQQRLPSQLEKLLQAGLPLLAQTYSDTAGAAVLKHLKAAGSTPQGAGAPSRGSKEDSHHAHELQLWNQYGHWFASGMRQRPLAPPAPQTASTITSSSSSRSPSGGAHSSSQQQESCLATSGLFLCLVHIDHILSWAAKVPRPLEVAALLPLVVDHGTGSFSLLAQAAEALLLPHTQGALHMEACSMLLRIWTVAAVFYDSVSQAIFSSSSSASRSSSSSSGASSGGGRKGGGSSSGSREDGSGSSGSGGGSSSSGGGSKSCGGSGTNSRPHYHYVPPYMREVPAMAELVHWYLQQPDNTRGKSGAAQTAAYLTCAVTQLHMLVDTAAAAERGWVVSDALPNQHQDASQQGSRQQAGAQLAADTPGTGVAGVPGDVFGQGPIRDKVEHLLWRALATYTASIQAHVDVLTSSSSSSNRRGSRGSSSVSTTPNSRRMLPKGAAYDLQLSRKDALLMYGETVAALLQLSLGTVPRQQLQALHGASPWLQAARAAGMVQQSFTALKELRDRPEANNSELVNLMTAFAKLMTAPFSKTPATTTTTSSSSSKAATSANNSGTSAASTSSSSSSRDKGQSVDQPQQQGPSRPQSAAAGSFVKQAALESVMAALEGPPPPVGFLWWPGALGSSPLGVGGSSEGATAGSLSPAAATSPLGSRDHTSNSTSSTSSTNGDTPTSCPPASGLATTDSSTTADPAAADDLLAAAGTRLQILAAAVSASWRDIKGMCLTSPGSSSSQVTGIKQAWVGLFQVLLLVVQQLQTVPVQLRADFLNSPYGGSVLQVMIEMQLEQDLMGESMGTAVFGGTYQGAAGTQQQQQPVAEWHPYYTNGWAVMEELLLPGLLLQLIPEERVAVQDTNGIGSSSSSTATSGSSSSSSRSSKPVGLACGGNPELPAAASGVPVVIELQEGLLLPLRLVPHGALQLAPGCTLPPAAFFLVEQLVRVGHGEPLDLALRLLQGSVGLVRTSKQLLSACRSGKQAAEAELHRLAYCSLLSTVVQRAIKLDKLGKLGAAGAAPLGALSARLIHVADDLDALSNSSCDGSRGGSSRDGSGGDGSSSGGSGGRGSGGSSGDGSGGASGGSGGDGDGGSSSHRPVADPVSAGHSAVEIEGVGSGGARSSGQWSLAASLAAAAAAGAFVAHVCAGNQPDPSAEDTPGPHTDGGEAGGKHGTSSSYAGGSSGTSSSGGSSNLTGDDTTGGSPQPIGGHGSAAAAVAAAAAPLPTGSGVHSPECVICEAGVSLYLSLGCLERGIGLQVYQLGEPEVEGLQQPAAELLAEAAKQRGTTLRQHLREQLLALAWRHPVPGVCGNVLCERLEGPSAVERGRVGSLCGGCRAVQYCCEECQRAAWAAHRHVCRGRG